MILEGQYKVKPFTFPEADEYLDALINIQMADTGWIGHMYTNLFFYEATQLIANAIHLFQSGYFDCAFYSLRQSLEISLSVIYLDENQVRIKSWCALSDDFQNNQMFKSLQETNANFKELRSACKDFFDGFQKIRRRINKYIHKQGYESFYHTFSEHDINKERVRRFRIKQDFSVATQKCIGIIALYRLAIDPLPVVLMDEEVMLRSDDLITESFSPNFVKKYIGEDILNRFKETSMYQSLHDWFMNRDKQNEAVFMLIHYQMFHREDFNAICQQVNLCSLHDLIAVAIFMCSEHISRIFISDGILEYNSNTKSNRESGTTYFGPSYYEDLFSDKSHNYNLPYYNAYISRLKIYNEWEYIEHNECLTNKEIQLLELSSEKLSVDYKNMDEQIRTLLAEHKIDICPE